MDALDPFIGTILLVIGVFLAFAGAKFLFQAIGAFVFLLTTGLVFMLSYNFLPPDKVSGGGGIALLIGIGLVSLALGTAVAYYSYRFAKEWSVALLAAWGGIALGFFVVRLAHIHSGTASLLIALAGAVFGGWLGRKMTRMIRCLGTAFVGSFLIVRGVACYAGGYPSGQADGAVKADHLAICLYLLGLVLLTVAGTWWQLRIFKAEVKEDDHFTAADYPRD